MTLPPLTPEQREMVEANLGLCGWAVNRWARHLPADDGPYTQRDAYQDAVLGLVTAVRKFDPDRGYRFATYASSWLHQSIQRGQGQFEGRNYRRILSRTADETDRTPPLRLDLLMGDTEGSLADTLEDTYDHDGHTERSLLVVQIVSLRSEVCDDEIDADLFDAMTDRDEHRSPQAVFTEVGLRHGYSREALRRRWINMAGRIRDKVDA